MTHSWSVQSIEFDAVPIAPKKNKTIEKCVFRCCVPCRLVCGSFHSGLFVRRALSNGMAPKQIKIHNFHLLHVSTSSTRQKHGRQESILTLK